jgi:hypothetical protein
MQPLVTTPPLNSQKWVYVSLRVRDGDRVLKPSHVSFDHVRFPVPPRLADSQIEIILTNGDLEDRRVAAVLPHDANDMRIPIRLLAE